MEENHHHEHGTADQHSAPSLRVKPKLSLDKYLSVLASGDSSGFSKRDLNTILSIHGSKQIHGKKEQLMEAVSKMELRDFSRSTLGECIHPAPMTLTNVVKDLTQMNWQACPVVSVRSISSTRYHAKSPTCNSKASVDPAGLKSAKKNNTNKTGPVSKPKSRGKSGKSVSSGEDNSNDQKDNGVLMTGTSVSSSSTMPEENPKPANKRKRKVSQKGPEHLLSGNMPNLSLELDTFA